MPTSHWCRSSRVIVVVAAEAGTFARCYVYRAGDFRARSIRRVAGHSIFPLRARVEKKRRC